MTMVPHTAEVKSSGKTRQMFTRLMQAHGRKLVILLPLVWFMLLFALPFLIVLKISFADIARAIPPYTDLMTWTDGVLDIALNFGNYIQLTGDALYIESYLQSLEVAAISTLLCLIIGYPLACAVAVVMLLLLILPILWFHKYQNKERGDSV